MHDFDIQYDIGLRTGVVYGILCGKSISIRSFNFPLEPRKHASIACGVCFYSAQYIYIIIYIYVFYGQLTVKTIQGCCGITSLVFNLIPHDHVLFTSKLTQLCEFVEESRFLSIYIEDTRPTQKATPYTLSSLQEQFCVYYIDF